MARSTASWRTVGSWSPAVSEPEAIPLRDLIDQLAVDGHAAVEVDREPERAAVPSHACQCTTILVH